MIKCKYEGTGIWNGRCVGTKEVDPFLWCGAGSANIITGSKNRATGRVFITASSRT